METLTYSMNRFTTDQLIGEVVRRTATDGPALRLFETTIIRARLAAGDRVRVAPECLPEAEPAIAAAGTATVVHATVEMGLADDGAILALVLTDGHEVDADTLDAHTHDHTHGKKATWRLAAHEHFHLHGPDNSDDDADGQLNGHIHARAHVKQPWESFDSDR